MTDTPPGYNADIENKNHAKCVERFIELANAMKDEGLMPGVVSHALMSASGVYATYVIAGNANAINAAGIEKLAGLYQLSLENIQKSKKEIAGSR